MRDYPTAGQLYLYLDLHAHAGKRGSFIYGNFFEEISDQTHAMLYPRLIAMNTLNFDFNECNFSEKLMKKKDKKGVSREGAGRVAIYRECPGLIHSYTLECNYACGVVLNQIEERYDIEKKKHIADTEAVLDPRTYQPYLFQDEDIVQYRFSGTIFHDIGRACLVAVLDMIYANPNPRVSSMSDVKSDLTY